MAMHLFLPSLVCKEVVGQRVGTGGTVAGHFGDKIMCSNQLPSDSWRWRHDEIRLCIINMCIDSKIRAEAEVFGRFRDLIPAELTQPGGELQLGRQRVGITPDLLLRLPTPDGVHDCLGELKAMSAGFPRAIHRGGMKSRRTGELRSWQPPTGGHCRGWTSSTGGRHQ